MESRYWHVTLEGTPHRIKLEHSPATGTRRIWVDGKRILDIRPEGFDVGSVTRFEVAGHVLHVRTRADEELMSFRQGENQVKFTYDLFIDGFHEQTGEALNLAAEEERITRLHRKAKRQMWLLVVMCIPLVLAIGLGESSLASRNISCRSTDMGRFSHGRDSARRWIAGAKGRR